MSPRNDKLDGRLREIDPLDHLIVDTAAWERRSEQLLAEILASNPRSTAKAARARGRIRLTTRGRFAALAAAGSAVLAIMVVGLPGGGSEQDPPVLPALARVAEAAADQPGPDAGLPYTYVKTRDMGISASVAAGQSWSRFVSTVSEKWIANDGSGRLRRTEAEPVWVSPADQEAWEAAGGAGSLPVEASPRSEEAVFRDGCRARLFLGEWLSSAELAEIPTGPEELAAWLEDRVTDPRGGAGAGNGFSIAVRTLALSSELLTDPQVSPGLRAALYEAEGLIPGIEYLGPTKDAIGRLGVAVGAESANSGAPSLYSLIFDPETSKVLASETTMLKPPSAMPKLPTPMVSEAKLFLEAGSVGSLTELPDGRHRPLGTARRMDLPKHFAC